jgi:hypothetical protein
MPRPPAKMNVGSGRRYPPILFHVPHPLVEKPAADEVIVTICGPLPIPEALVCVYEPENPDRVDHQQYVFPPLLDR